MKCPLCGNEEFIEIYISSNSSDHYFSMKTGPCHPSITVVSCTTCGLMMVKEEEDVEPE